MIKIINTGLKIKISDMLNVYSKKRKLIIRNNPNNKVIVNQIIYNLGFVKNKTKATISIKTLKIKLFSTA